MPLVAGFGLGAVNDADEDDLDIYDGGDDLGSRRRMAFDTDEAEETITIGASSRKAPKSRSTGSKIVSQKPKRLEALF